MTPEFEARIKKAVEDGTLPGVVLLAKDKSGKIDYNLCLGTTCLKPKAPPMSLNTMFCMASMTKLLTACGVLLLIQDGTLHINEDITKYVPELSAQPVLKGFDADGQPILGERTTPITVRHLLTHTSGLGYIVMEEDLLKWAKATGSRIPVPLRHTPISGGKSVEVRFAYPLLNEPGEGWVYGGGLDWGGRLIEKLTGAFFDDYMYDRVLRPVGVPQLAITFHPGRFSQRPYDVIAGMSKRHPETGKVEFMPTEMDNDNDGFGGEGLFGGMGEYMKVVYSLLMDDGKILKPEIAKYLFEPLLEPVEKKALNKKMENPDWAVGHIPTGVDYDWTAGGLITTHDVGHRKKGFLQWGGAWNLSWFIDRESGVCGVFGAQMFPPGDQVIRGFMKDFEDTIYSKL